MHERDAQISEGSSLERVSGIYFSYHAQKPPTHNENIPPTGMSPLGRVTCQYSALSLTQYRYAGHVKVCCFTFHAPRVLVYYIVTLEEQPAVMCI